MSRWSIGRRTFRDGLIVVIGLAALGLAWAFFAHRPTGRMVGLKMTAGRAEGSRHRIARALADEARRRDLSIELVSQAGSIEALDWVNAGRSRAALVQGGLKPADRKHVRQVAALHVEPLHLLVKEEYAEDTRASLAALRGKVVNLGEPGSGTRALAEEVLGFVGLSPRDARGRGDYRATALSYADLKAQADRDKLPDAVFMVATLPAEVAAHLIVKRGYRLAPVPFGKIFWLDAAERPADAVDRIHVYDAEIPALAYSRDPAVPERPVPTLGTRLLLVAHEDTDPKVVGRLLEALFTAGFAQRAQPPLDARLLDLPPELEWHAGTVQYRERNKPLIAGEVIDSLEKEISIIAAVLGGLFFLGQWLRRRYRRRRDRGFESYMLRVAAIERRVMALELAPTRDLDALLALQKDLSTLKGEALEKFADGEIEGEALVSSFLTHVSDTRDYLTRLILHERERLDELAALQARDTASGAVL